MTNETWVAELDESIFEETNKQQSAYENDLEKLCLTDEYLEAIQEEIKFKLDIYVAQLQELEGLEDKVGDEFKTEYDILVKLVDYLKFQYDLIQDNTVVEWFKNETYKAVEAKIGKDGITLAASAIEVMETAARECNVMGDNLQEYIINTCAKQFPDLIDAEAIKEMFVTPVGNNTIN
jgi:hypothetical protein